MVQELSPAAVTIPASTNSRRRGEILRLLATGSLVFMALDWLVGLLLFFELCFSAVRRLDWQTTLQAVHWCLRKRAGPLTCDFEKSENKISLRAKFRCDCMKQA